MTSKINLLEFKRRASEKHQYRYHYDLVKFKNMGSKIQIICPIHGIFLQRANAHLGGQGCRSCGIYRRLTKTQSERDQRKRTNIKNKQDKMVENIKQKNLKKIKGMQLTGLITPIEEITHEINRGSLLKFSCPKHGIYYQSLNFLYRNKTNRCRLCKHADELIQFLNSCILSPTLLPETIQRESACEISIVCQIHGRFKKHRSNFKRGWHCPKCKNTKFKKQFDWLDSFKNENIIYNYEFKLDGKIFKVDGFDPETNTIYEYYGDYWHGNPKVYKPEKINKTKKKTFGELYESTIAREKKLKNAGFFLKTAWET